MAYTLLFELTDATLDVAYYSMPNKREAIEAARRAAADAMHDVHAIIVIDEAGQCIFTAPTGRPMLTSLQ